MTPTISEMAHPCNVLLNFAHNHLFKIRQLHQLLSIQAARLLIDDTQRPQPHTIAGDQGSSCIEPDVRRPGHQRILHEPAQPSVSTQANEGAEYQRRMCSSDTDACMPGCTGSEKKWPIMAET